MKNVEIEGVNIPIPESYSDCFELIRSDFYRYTGRRIASPLKLWVHHFRESGCGFLFYYRLSRYKGFLWPFFRFRLERYKRKYGLQLSLDTPVGYGLYLGHGMNIVVNRNAVIGNNVNLSQFTTIGSNKGTAAIIEDEAYVGPTVCTVERVRIGRRAVVGAGSVVTKDVTANSAFAGVPAKMINNESGYSPVNLWIIKNQ